jgi:hypothetical protein
MAIQDLSFAGGYIGKAIRLSGFIKLYKHFNTGLKKLQEAVLYCNFLIAQ